MGEKKPRRKLSGEPKLKLLQEMPQRKTPSTGDHKKMTTKGGARASSLPKSLVYDGSVPPPLIGSQTPVLKQMKKLKVKTDH